MMITEMKTFSKNGELYISKLLESISDAETKDILFAEVKNLFKHENPYWKFQKPPELENRFVIEYTSKENRETYVRVCFDFRNNEINLYVVDNRSNLLQRHNVYDEILIPWQSFYRNRTTQEKLALWFDSAIESNGNFGQIFKMTKTISLIEK